MSKLLVSALHYSLEIDSPSRGRKPDDRDRETHLRKLFRLEIDSPSRGRKLDQNAIPSKMCMD